MSKEERRKELSRLILEKANGLELVMNRYQRVTGHFPSIDLSPRQIIEAIVEHEDSTSHTLEDAHG